MIILLCKVIQKHQLVSHQINKSQEINFTQYHQLEKQSNVEKVAGKKLQIQNLQ